jgi:hypothetical protein
MTRIIMFRTRIAALVVGVAAVATLGIGSGVAANASVLNTPEYTTAGVNSIAGWYGTANNGVAPTHLSAYLGSSGNSSLSNLPQAVVDSTGKITSVPGGLGMALCDATTGEAVQVGDVNIGGGKMDVVAASGDFGTAINNNDRCQNGVVNPTASTGSHTVSETVAFSYAPNSNILTVTSGRTPAVGTAVTITIPVADVANANTVLGSTIFNATTGIGTLYVTNATFHTFELATTTNGTPITVPSTVAAGSYTATWTVTAHSTGQDFQVLLQNVPVNDTVAVDMQLNKGFSFGAATGVTASAKDISVNQPGASATFSLPGNTVFDEVDTGVVADTTLSVALTGVTVPAFNGNGTTSSAPNELARVAHFDVSANVQGAHEFHGAKATAGAPLASSTAFTASPVVATIGGTANVNNVKLDTSNWFEDNMYISQGSLVG